MLKLDPFLVGGAAGHLLSGRIYNDLDFCYYITGDNRFDDIPTIIADYLIEIIRRSSVAPLPELTRSFRTYILNLYLKMHLIKEDPENYNSKSLVSIFKFLEGIDLKFIPINDTFRSSVSRTDGVHVCVLTGNVFVMNGAEYCSLAKSEDAIQDLCMGRYPVDQPLDVRKLFFRLVQKTTQGFFIEPHLLGIAIKNLLSEFSEQVDFKATSLGIILAIIILTTPLDVLWKG